MINRKKQISNESWDPLNPIDSLTPLETEVTKIAAILAGNRSYPLSTDQDSFDADYWAKTAVRLLLATAYELHLTTAGIELHSYEYLRKIEGLDKISTTFEQLLAEPLLKESGKSRILGTIRRRDVLESKIIEIFNAPNVGCRDPESIIASEGLNRSELEILKQRCGTRSRKTATNKKGQTQRKKTNRTAR